MSDFGSQYFGLYDEARAELADQELVVHEREFYSRKICAAWGRARCSKAYERLSDFDIGHFLKLPVTDRIELKENPLDFLAVPVRQALKYYETTGTTGRPTPTPRLREDVIWNIVSVAEAWRSILQVDDRILVMLPSDIVPVADLIVGVSEYLGIAHAKAYPFTVGISDWDRLAYLWENFEPTVLFIAPGVMQQFTRILKQRGNFEHFNRHMRAIMLLGEVNTSAFRRRIGEWWGAKVYDVSYGSTETGTLAASCKQGQLHLLTGANYFEIATEHGLVPLPLKGEVRGRLVVTPLNLYARPLLRLDTGDVVTVSIGCSCGATSPCVIVHGRSSDGIRVHDQPVTVRALEDVVYSATQATGYLIEITENGDYARLLLERNTSDWDRANEDILAAQVQATSLHFLLVEWNAVVFVNNLPVNTKSGASQKSWKRSNIRLIEAPQA